MPANGHCCKTTLLHSQIMIPRRKGSPLRLFSTLRPGAGLAIGSRGVLGTRIIKKQKGCPRRCKHLKPIVKGPKLPIALRRQQPTRRRDEYANQWLDDGDKWRSLLRSRKSASQVNARSPPGVQRQPRYAKACGEQRSAEGRGHLHRRGSFVDFC